ncbi:MAG: tyrosine-type recombinase/integrase [Clostridia bacterium]|nr:tyrosine-type recombinase/integrase [Clostridia bacterium]
MKTITNLLIEKYREYLMNEEKAPATINKYIHDMLVFSAWISGAEVTKTEVLKYKQQLIEEYAPASVNSVISSLNSFFVFNEWYDCRVKLLKIQKQIFADKNKELTKAEYSRLLTAAQKKKNQKLYYLMQTICSSGIRISELKFVTAEAVKAKQAVIRCKGKTRIVILPKQLCKILKIYIKENNIHNGPVFVTRSGKPLDRSNIWRLMKGLCESAGVSKDKVFPHNLRHLFARTYYSIQKDIVRLADILGHSSINTTRIYTKETGEIHRSQIQKLGLLRC